VRFLHPAFGGINLEDIKAPECFVIEERLRELLEIPVFHDDQHGTAIIAAAGLINALHLTGVSSTGPRWSSTAQPMSSNSQNENWTNRSASCGVTKALSRPRRLALTTRRW
jgi:hypothetical protein